jgi:hypothetical protein
VRKYSKQQLCKRLAGHCFFCKEADYALLDAHRIIEGGVYHPDNILVTCASCHRRIHAGEIVIDRKYLATNGKQVLHYWRNGKEFWHD